MLLELYAESAAKISSKILKYIFLLLGTPDLTSLFTSTNYPINEYMINKDEA